MINVVLFASVREKAGCESVEVNHTQGLTVAGLKQQLMEKSVSWQQALSGKVLTAVNQKMVDESVLLTDHCEVAFFPPVTGG